MDGKCFDHLASEDVCTCSEIQEEMSPEHTKSI